ncbi:MAG: prephenate dehydrogenase/arogenate dehydrogenase family protein, partial [Candidatus Omnitrophota bacterium]
KKRKMARLVIGISRHKKTIDSALARKAIDRGFCDISAVRGADMVVLASPVSSIIQNGRRIAALIKPGALVTDTGSTKREIVGKLEKILPNFVGAHPLAGSEKQGVINANENLFRDSWCILTPTKRTPKTALNKIKKFWRALGAKVIYISPLKHDRYISYISHLPHVVAFSLIHSIPRNTFHLASGGLKDTTRIAASGDELWRDILVTNPDNVLAALEAFDNSLSRIKSAIIKRDAKALAKILKQARLKRIELNRK